MVPDPPRRSTARYISRPLDLNEPTGGYDYDYGWGSNTTTASTTATITYSTRTTATTYVRIVPDLPKSFWNEPPNVVRTREALDWMVRRSREKSPPPLTAKARHGYQELARIPCYRGVRTR